MRELFVHVDCAGHCGMMHAVTGLPPQLQRLTLTGQVFLLVEALPPALLYLESASVLLQRRSLTGDTLFSMEQLPLLLRTIKSRYYHYSVIKSHCHWSRGVPLALPDTLETVIVGDVKGMPQMGFPPLLRRLKLPEGYTAPLPALPFAAVEVGHEYPHASTRANTGLQRYMMTAHGGALCSRNADPAKCRWCL